MMGVGGGGWVSESPASHLDDCWGILQGAHANLLARGIRAKEPIHAYKWPIFNVTHSTFYAPLIEQPFLSLVGISFLECSAYMEEYI